MNEHAFWYLSRASGMVAWVILAITCLWGILLITRMLKPADRPAWLLQVTNDAWFGNLSGPWQHLAQARLRAIESGLPLMRAANTGVSAVIDAKGRVLHSLPLNSEGVIDVAVPAALPPTLYARTGDYPMMLLLAGGIAGLIAFRRRQSD